MTTTVLISCTVVSGPQAQDDRSLSDGDRTGRRRDLREVTDAIAHKFRTGTQRDPLPGEYGDWQGVCNRL
ncbi:transposase [Streptomyces bacillaris]|uniref:transposase n=1 Tax=Streptomyces bacillaris TaxID=68179 RepID=UPI0013A6B681